MVPHLGHTKPTVVVVVVVVSVYHNVGIAQNITWYKREYMYIYNVRFGPTFAGIYMTLGLDLRLQASKPSCHV